MNKKKLAILVPAFPGKESGSYMVPFIQQFLTAFIKYHNDIELTVYSLYIPKGDSYFWNGIKIIPLNGKKSNLLTKLLFIVRSTFVISRHIRKSKIDGILSFWYNETALIGNIISFLHTKKHYTWLQGQDVKKTNSYIKFLRPEGKSLITLSTHQNNILYKELGFKAKTINPIAVNPTFFPQFNKGLREVDILGAGSFIPLKNYQLFLSSILEIKKNNFDIKVVLIGNGPLDKEFKRFIKNNKLENNVILPGLLSHKETLNYMNNSKIFLHTSNFEGGGMVLYESLYLGCQVVSTIPIEDNTIFNFHHCSSKEEIVAVLKNLINNPIPHQQSSSTNIKETSEVIYNLFFS